MPEDDGVIYSILKMEVIFSENTEKADVAWIQDGTDRKTGRDPMHVKVSSDGRQYWWCNPRLRRNSNSGNSELRFLKFKSWMKDLGQKTKRARNDSSSVKNH